MVIDVPNCNQMDQYVHIWCSPNVRYVSLLQSHPPKIFPSHPSLATGLLDRQNRSHHFRQAVNLAQFSCLSVGTGPNCLPSALVWRLKTYLYRFSTIFSTLIKPKYVNKLGNSQCMEQARPENPACHLAKPVLNDVDITRGKHEYIA